MDVDDGVRSYACAAVDDCAPERITAVRRFESGERHAVFKVSYVDPDEGTNDLVVRISLSNDSIECAQAAREASVLEKVQGVAAPLLHDFRLESPWFDAPAMCMQFVPGQQRELIATASEDLERLGSVVGLVHRLPTDDLVGSFPDTEPAATYRDARVAQVVAYLSSVRDPLPAAVQRRLRRAVRFVHESLEAARTAETFGTDAPLVLLHGDVAGGNVIWAPEPVLIDWEYARFGDPADEIAYTFTQNGLTASQRQAFWRGYRDRTVAEGRVEPVVARVAWWEPVTLLGSSLWWIQRWSRRVDADAAGDADPSAPKAPRYYLDQALRRLDRFDELPLS